MGLGEHPNRIIVSPSWSMGAIDVCPSELPPPVAVEVMRKTTGQRCDSQAKRADRKAAGRVGSAQSTRDGKAESTDSGGWAVPAVGRRAQFRGQGVGLKINLPLLDFTRVK